MASRSLVHRQLVAGRGFASAAIALLSLPWLARCGHSTLRAIVQLVVFLPVGCVVSSSSNATTRYPLAAIVRRTAGPIRRVCSISSMLLVHWRQRRRDAAFPPHAGQWSVADCESVHGCLRWQRPAGVPNRVRDYPVLSSSALGRCNLARGELRRSRLSVTLLSHAPGPILSAHR